MEYLQQDEIKSYVSVLKSIGQLYVNDNEILDDALAKFEDKAPLVELKSALESIAGVEYRKHFCSNDKIRVFARLITKKYTAMSEERGYEFL